jgi:hypothetical protein
LTPSADAQLRDASRVLVLGIGGGGDVVGCLAAAALAQERGTDAVVGGLTWERRPVDPLPGPRQLEECHGIEQLHEAAALATPQAGGPGGFRFAEGRVAELLGRPTVLIDPHPGPRAIAGGIAAAAEHLDCDLVVLLDVGGDALAHGDEAGLGSPLADAVLLAAEPHLRELGVHAIGAVFGAGCDGELTPAEVKARLDEVRAAGGDLGSLRPRDLGILERAVATVPTEASAMALRCARGETGAVSIRDGRRTVPLTPDGGVVAFFDIAAALGSAARMAAALIGATSLQEADDVLTARGVRTELRYEAELAQEG